jgi:hypothetical protein
MTDKMKDDVGPEDFGISALDAEKARNYADFRVATERERWRTDLCAALRKEGFGCACVPGYRCGPCGLVDLVRA